MIKHLKNLYKRIVIKNALLIQAEQGGFIGYNIDLANPLRESQKEIRESLLFLSILFLFIASGFASYYVAFC